MDSVAANSFSPPALAARGAVPTLAVIVPVHVEPDIDRQLDGIAALRPDELIVVEAGDVATGGCLQAFASKKAHPTSVRILRAARGRALQMNAGAKQAKSDVLLFVHADTELPANALTVVREAIAQGQVWGRFDVRLSGASTAFRVIEWTMNCRSALTGIATGDQAIFVRRDVFNMLGGFAPIALMEDIEMSSRLKWVASPHRLRASVTTSSRRWERDGVVRTVIKMWLLRSFFALGASPTLLARWYR